MSAGILPVQREAFSQRPEWRGFSPRQLSGLMFLHGYTTDPAEEFEIAAPPLPLALEDLERAA